MFKISAAGEYALHLVRFLSDHPGIHTLESLSANAGIPLPMLRKISAKLEKAGIVVSKKGRSGGISGPDFRPSVKDVLLAAGEDLSIVVCSKGTVECSSQSACSIAPVLKNLQRGFESILSITRL